MPAMNEIQQTREAIKGMNVTTVTKEKITTSQEKLSQSSSQNNGALIKGQIKRSEVKNMNFNVAQLYPQDQSVGYKDIQEKAVTLAR
jgi:hypothetical protein